LDAGTNGKGKEEIAWNKGDKSDKGDVGLTCQRLMAKATATRTSLNMQRWRCCSISSYLYYLYMILLWMPCRCIAVARNLLQCITMGYYGLHEYNATIGFGPLGDGYTRPRSADHALYGKMLKRDHPLSATERSRKSHISTTLPPKKSVLEVM
jgi:hypothetical protein